MNANVKGFRSNSLQVGYFSITYISFIVLRKPSTSTSITILKVKMSFSKSNYLIWLSEAVIRTSRVYILRIIQKDTKPSCKPFCAYKTLWKLVVCEKFMVYKLKELETWHEIPSDDKIVRMPYELRVWQATLVCILSRDLNKRTSPW